MIGTDQCIDALERILTTYGNSDNNLHFLCTLGKIELEFLRNYSISNYAMSHDLQAGATLDHNANGSSVRRRGPLAAPKTTEDTPPPPSEVRLLPIASIRTDGDTQHRIAPDPSIVGEYAELMQAGVNLPPVDVRYDGKDYWLSDGFRRLEAARLAHLPDFRAAIRPGTREDAQWDSYAANATHGLRRSNAETEKVIRLALQHPNADKMSNVQIAKHLHISEATVRRWREKSSSSPDEDSVREVTRGGVTYDQNIRKIGRNSARRRVVNRHSLRHDLDAMKQEAGQATRGLLAIVEKWVRGQAEPQECIRSIEQFLWGHRAEFVAPPLGGKRNPLPFKREEAGC